MVKRRRPKASAEDFTPTAEQINRFADGADQGARTPPKTQSPRAPHTRSARNFKAIRVPFNEAEFNALTELAELTGRSKLDAVRFAIAEQVKREQRKAKRAQKRGR